MKSQKNLFVIYLLIWFQVVLSVAYCRFNLISSIPFYQTNFNLSKAIPCDTFQQKYHADTIFKNSHDFFKNYSNTEKEIILAINRVSENRIIKGFELIVPDNLSHDILCYSPFPNSFAELFFLKKCIIISQRIQAFAAYENGSLVRWGPVSTGSRATPTPNGLFFTNWKARLKQSTIDSDWIMPWYVNIENKRGIALHEYVLPGYPASHACIRLFEKDAIWIYNWIDVWILEKKSKLIIKNGTPVLIFGIFDFKKTSPWKNLVLDPESNKFNNQDLEELNSYIGQLDPSYLKRSH